MDYRETRHDDLDGWHLLQVLAHADDFRAWEADLSSVYDWSTEQEGLNT